ncbi:hypothetical protein HNQ51_001567 [Inhella inkyongensis]|uniref:4Fe-4S ferredoxin-type domain-containing protein n=1 Tax=Inhella inkyongensis TaxID=392593 RepID=A0A840S3F1_9BURK|nr:hypothetical protein [Inhella inkyongensis]MBB5204253.1 hypothetical protein [Inhella inkyongensis]
MNSSRRLVAIHPSAPAKPALGAPCNGCGLCCLAEPCPLGMLASRSRQGACRALEWQAEAARYRCGLLRAPAAHLLGLKAKAPHAVDALLRPLARRWIAAGIGCDADIEAQPAKAPEA